MKHYLVYQITNLINQKIYIGIHVTKNLNDGYMGSGKAIINAIKKYGIESFKKEILYDFDNPDEMIEKERLLVNRQFIARKDVYNLTCGGRVPITWDTTCVKDKEGNVFRVRCDDPRKLTGELVNINIGKIVVKDDYGNVFCVTIDDPRYLSGELKHNTHGTAVIKDFDGNIFRVSVDDPRYLSGELVGIWKGRKHSEESKKQIGSTNKLKLQTGKMIHSGVGTCWIYNEVESKKIKKEYLDSFLLEGWIKGRKMKFK